MKKYSREKCKLFECIIRQMLIIRANSLDPFSADYQNIQDKRQEDFFNRLFTFDKYKASYKASDVSKYINEKFGYPDHFYDRLKSDVGVSEKFIKNIQMILAEKPFNDNLDSLEIFIKNWFVQNKVTKKGKLKEIKAKSTSAQYIINAIRRSLEYIFDDSVINYSITSERPRAVSGFIGRAKELEKISECLSDKKYVVLSGIGGMGKTSLAHEYLAKYKEQYKLIKTVLFDTDIKTTIASIECSGFTEDTKAEERYKKVRELLNEYGSDAIVLIDNFNANNFVDDEEYFEQMLSRFECRFIITMRANLNSAISVDALDDEELATLFLTQIITRTNHHELIRQNIATIIEALHRNTLLVELSGKVFDCSNLSLTQFIKEISGEDPKYDEKKVKHGTTICNTEEHLLRLFSIAGLSNDKKQILLDFALLAEGAMIETKIAERLFRPYTIDNFEEMNRLGWVKKGYNDIEDDHTWGLHPLIASTLRRMSSFKSCSFERELQNIEHFSFLYAMDGNSHLASSLYSIAVKVKVDSRQLALCRSRICKWLYFNNRHDLAYKIYCECKDKRSLLPEVYICFSEYADKDPELLQITAEMNRLVEAEMKEINITNSLFATGRKKDYYELISTDPLKKIRNDNLYLFTCINSIKNDLSGLNYVIFTNRLSLIRMIIYSYRSVDAYNELPIYVDGIVFLDYLKKQILCSNIEDTDIYKTVYSVLKGHTEEIGCSFVADIDILRYVLFSVANAEYLNQIRLRIAELEPEHEKINAMITEYLEFIDENSRYLNYTILMDYNIQLAYCYCDYGNLKSAREIIAKYKQFDYIFNPARYFDLQILGMYCDCMEILWQHQTELPSDMLSALITRFDTLLGFITEKSKDTPEHGVNVPYIQLIAMRAICIILSWFYQVIENTELKEKYEDYLAEFMAIVYNSAFLCNDPTDAGINLIVKCYHQFKEPFLTLLNDIGL